MSRRTVSMAQGPADAAQCAYCSSYGCCTARVGSEARDTHNHKESPDKQRPQALRLADP